MEAKTSTKQTTPSSQLNSKIAKGKRKENCGRLALSLQDVFSDSANLEGMQQKTSRQFKSEQEKWRNFKIEKIKRRAVERKWSHLRKDL